jgi:hypothetical protein
MLSYGGFPLGSSPILALGGSSPALHSRRSRTGCADALRARRRPFARLVVAQRAHAFNHWPISQERAAALARRSKNEFNLLFARTVRRALAICEFVAPGIALLSPALAARRGAPCGNRVVGRTERLSRTTKRRRWRSLSSSRASTDVVGHAFRDSSEPQRETAAPRNLGRGLDLFDVLDRHRSSREALSQRSLHE